MGAFGGLVLTNRGRALQAKAQTGVELLFTRIGCGDGNLGGQSIQDLNALISEKKSLELTKLRVLQDNKAVVGAILSNQEISAGFYFREIGVFAQDPDQGEILYCYGNAGNNAEYIPAGGGPDIVEKNIDVITIVGNAQNVNAVIDQSLIFATPAEAQEMADAALSAANEYTDQQLSQIELTAENVTLDSPNFQANNLKGAMEELFIDVDNGKNNVASAITDMGQNASGGDTFPQLSAKIRDISKDANAAVGDVENGKTFYAGGQKRVGTLALDGDAAVGDVLAGKTFFNNALKTKRTGTMPNRTGHVTGQSVSRNNTTLRIRPQAGYYPGDIGNSVQIADANFIAGNIKQGVSIFGLAGNLVPGENWASKVPHGSNVVSNPTGGIITEIVGSGYLYSVVSNNGTGIGWLYVNIDNRGWWYVQRPHYGGDSTLFMLRFNTRLQVRGVSLQICYMLD